MNIDININQILNMLNIVPSSETPDNIMALCCFHSEKTPSWNISKSYPYLWHCYACNVSGNIFSLIKRKTGKSLYKFLDIKDISSYEFNQNLKNIKTIKQEKKSRRMTISGELKNPIQNVEVMSYLESRGIGKEFIEYFNLSYVDYAEINSTKMYNRVLIPVVYNNRLINVEARDFTKRSKKKVLYPRGGISDTLFNYDRLDFNKPVYCVEGIFDLPKLFELGERNITCSFGAALGNKQKQLLCNIKNLVWIPDNDEAGLMILEKLDEIMNEEWSIAFLNDFIKDPGDASKEQIKEAINNRVEAVQFFAEKHLGKKEILDW